MYINLIKSLINQLGYDVMKYTSIDDRKDIFSKIKLSSVENIIDIDALGNSSLLVPGMIPAKSGQFLYTLCYFQRLRGDVVEIGSWQGRSTTFLAMAAKNSGNGKVYAIDHFKGNLGVENCYRIRKSDLSDLKTKFINNMEEMDLFEAIQLLDMSSEEAAKYIDDKSVRFLFIDGDHTKGGVRKDIELFTPKLKRGSIIVFDDFSARYPGLIDAVDELLGEVKFSRKMTYDRTLILRL